MPRSARVPCVDLDRVGAEPHGAAHVGDLALLGQQVDHRVRRLRDPSRSSWRPACPATWRANSLTATCIPRQTPRYGMPDSRASLAAAILPSNPRPPKPPGIRIPSTSRSSASTSGSPTRLGVDPFDLHAAAVMDAAVAQRLGHRQVGVLELHVLADQGDPHLVGQRGGAIDDRLPARRGPAAARRSRSGP